MNYTIREIEKRDDKAVEGVIRACLIEFGANHEGTAWADPDLCRFSEIYNTDGNRYWVAQDENGKIVGGVGIGGPITIWIFASFRKCTVCPRRGGRGLPTSLWRLLWNMQGNITRAVILRPLKIWWRRKDFTKNTVLSGPMSLSLTQSILPVT